MGNRADLCAASYGLASGVSFVTFSRARSDVTFDRPRRAQRKRARTTASEEAANQVTGYIRSLTRHLEGSKGGTYGIAVCEARHTAFAGRLAAAVVGTRARQRAHASLAHAIHRRPLRSHSEQTREREEWREII